MSPWIVGLDLGSESMAAAAWNGQTFMIDLQEYARVLNDKSSLLTDEDGRSKRLLNRILTRPGVQPPTLDDGHARLDLVAPGAMPNMPGTKLAYDTGLFEYFPDARLRARLDQNTIPNPKVIFHAGAAYLLPMPDSNVGGTKIALQPETIIQHLAAQIIRNFILRSQMMHRVDPTDVHLILTVPNVYSVMHAASLVSFLERLRSSGDPVLPGRISWIYESDAIAHSIFNEICMERAGARRRATQNETDDNQGVINHINSGFKDLAHDEAHLITVDIGRGTTDLSWVRIKPVRAANGNFTNRVKHKVIARTGRSEGGNYLTYLFVRHYYEPMLNGAFRTLGGSTPGRPIFSFVELLPRFVAPITEQGEALTALEQLIGLLKRSMRADYTIDWKTFSRFGADIQRESLPSGVTEWAEDGNAMPEREPETRLLQMVIAQLEAASQVGSNSARITFDADLRRVLLMALRFPDKGCGIDRMNDVRDTVRTGVGQIQSLLMALQRLLAKLRNTPLPAVSDPDADARKLADQINQQRRSNAATLAEQIKEYVTRNTTDLLDGLRKSAVLILCNLDSGQEIAAPVGIVAGQAAQFQPIRQAIQQWFADKPDSSLEFLSGSEAKMACCIGAVQYVANDASNPEIADILGTYGLRKPGGLEGPFVRLPNRKLNAGHPFVCVADPCVQHADGSIDSGDYHWVLVYSPDEFDEENRPQYNDGKTSYIGAIEGNLVLAHFDTVHRSLTIASVMGATGAEIDAANADPAAFFASPRCNKQMIVPTGANRPDADMLRSIYAKVWPEKLPAGDTL